MFGLEGKHFYAITLVLAVTGTLLAAYWGILATEDQQKIALATAMARLEMVEQSMKTMHDENNTFANEMRVTLGKISDNVADLRVIEATRQRK